MTGYTFNQLFDFTRTTSATFVGSNGLIQTTPASVNLLTYTQDFDNAAWTKTNATVTANSTVAPDGTSTADTLTASAGAGAGQQVFQTITNIGSGNYVYSIYVKQGSGATDSNAFIARNQTTGVNAAFISFNYQTGVITQVEGYGATAVSVGNGWWRLSIPFTLSATVGDAIRFYAGSTGAVETPGEFLYAWGAQVEAGSTATTYTRNNGGVYPARFDYDPVTLAPKGILIEEQRTNLLTYSQDWTNAAWSKTNITVTAAATASPDGTTNAQRLQATTTAATNVSTAGIAATATSATFSVYVKQGSSATAANSFALRNNTTATNLVLGTLNYSTGVWTYSTGSTGVTVSNAGNGWWRLQISASSGITAGNILIAYTGFLGASATAGDNLFAYGAQLEAGAFATSYIPTVASQVTRSGDACNIVAPMFAPWYNQSEGTFVVDFSSNGINTVSSSLFAVSDGTGNNILLPFINSGGISFVTVNSGGVASASLNTGAVAARTLYKHATAYQVNNFAATLNGAAPTVDTSGPVQVSVSGMNIGWAATYGGLYLNGHIRSIKFYPFRASNNQLQALTI